MKDKQSLDIQIRSELVKQLYNRYPLSAIMTLIIASILALVQLEVIKNEKIIPDEYVELFSFRNYNQP